MPSLNDTTTTIRPFPLAFSGLGSKRQQSEERCPDLPIHTHFLQLYWEDPEAFQDNLRDVASQACPRPFSGPPPDGTPPHEASATDARAGSSGREGEAALLCAPLR